MTDTDPTPDYRELMRSPYDPDEPKQRDEGESDLPWKPAVAAAVLGALLVSAFVVYAAATGGTDEPQATSSTTSTTVAVVAAEKNAGLPPGYVAIDGGAGARVEGVEVTNEATYLSVSSAVTGDEVPSEIPPIDVAYWELELADGTRPMVGQYGELGVLGNLTVQFDPLAVIRGASLVAHPAMGSTERSVSLELPADLPAEVVDYRIDLGSGRAVVVDELVIGDGWGNIRWSVDGDVPAKVDTIVTFVGTDDPSTEDVVDETRLTPSHLRTLGQGTGALPAGPLYAFGASQPLYRSGEPLVGGNVHSGIVVEFTVRIPESIGEPVRLEVPAS